MPVTLSFEEPARFVVEATGNVTGAEVVAAIDQLLQDPRFRRPISVLIIGEGITGVPASDELRDIASAMVSLKGAGMTGLVIATQPGFVYGVARMFSALAELVGVCVEVFLDQSEARARLEEISAQAA